MYACMHVCMYVCMYVCMLLFAVFVEEYASHLLVSKITAGLMTNDNNPKSAMVMLV